MGEEREILKRATIALLDDSAEEHELGHQGSKAKRYVLKATDGSDVEVMFERNASSPANVWCLRSAAGPKLMADINHKESPAITLWTKRGKNGDALYGRHSALEKMAQLGKADLVCLAPETIEQVRQIIDRLRSLTLADLR